MQTLTKNTTFNKEQLFIIIDNLDYADKVAIYEKISKEILEIKLKEFQNSNLTSDEILNEIEEIRTKNFLAGKHEI